MKPIRWVGSAKKDLMGFPAGVCREMGYGLYLAQCGDRHPSAKSLKGFGSAGVVELIEQAAGGTYRAIYTVRFPGVVYVLHAFQKKAKQGIATPVYEIDLVRQRLRLAEEDYQQWPVNGR